MYKGPYVAPTLVVDSVVFQLTDKDLSVLLINRTQEPFKGVWALPGGYCAAGETTSDAMSRILTAKTGVNYKDIKLVEQLYTFDTVARDPRGHAVSVTYMGLGFKLEPKNSHTAQNPQFFPINNLPELAYDHKDIIKYGHERLSAKITYTNAVFSMLPAKFTLSQLQQAYEAIFCHELDKRNFRKKFLDLDMIEQTNEMLKEGAHRPARLWRFKQQKLEILSRSFE